MVDNLDENMEVNGFQFYAIQQTDLSMLFDISQLGPLLKGKQLACLKLEICKEDFVGCMQ